MDLDLKGKGILVVGGSAGMGLAAARVLASEGAKLAIVGRDAERLEKAAAGLGDATVLPIAADVSRPGEAEGMVEKASDFLGRLDGVAILTGTIGHDPIEISDERWVEVFEDVVMGTTRVIRAVLPRMKDHGGALVTTSAYSIRAPEIARLPYTSLKSAVAVLTKGIAKEYGQYGIRANCVCPGAIETEALHALRVTLAKDRGWPIEEALERIMVEEWGLDIALGRPGRPEEVGELITFLLSPRAGYMTGALLNIDGGTNF
jgi:NAD(P)-dependent dehydrogenase (short-subunit alcohol dehydrogenase family)